MCNMKKMALIIGFLLCLLEVVVVVVYFIFNGPFSLNSQDWATFNQVVNGCVMAALTGVNILIFYKISNTIEENTKNRAIKQTLFEAQLIITQMRVKRYEELSLLINEIVVDLFQNKIYEDRIKQIKKILMNIDQSFLFQKDNFKDGSFLFSSIEDICALIEGKEDGYMDKLSDKLIGFKATMEMYIFGQMLREHDTMEYIKNHKGDIDSTFSCLDQIISDFNESLHRINNYKK